MSLKDQHDQAANPISEQFPNTINGLKEFASHMRAKIAEMDTRHDRLTAYLTDESKEELNDSKSACLSGLNTIDTIIEGREASADTVERVKGEMLDRASEYFDDLEQFQRVFELVNSPIGPEGSQP